MKKVARFSVGTAGGRACHLFCLENVLNSKRKERAYMEQRQFGKTDMQVSVLGFGGVEIEGTPWQEVKS
jgi:hypothetical protein